MSFIPRTLDLRLPRDGKRMRCKDSNPDAVYPAHIEPYPHKGAKEKKKKKLLDQTPGEQTNRSLIGSMNLEQKEKGAKQRKKKT